VRRRITTALLATTLLAGGSTLVGCSSSDAPAANGVESLAGQDVLSKALSAADAQTSMRMVTKGSRNNLDFLVDMKLRRDGGASGSVLIGKEKVSVVTTKTDVFLRADKAYWETQMDPTFAAAIGSMWVKAPVTSKTFATFANLGNYDGMLSTFLKPTGAATTGNVSNIATQPAVQVVSTQGSVWVATEGQPLPVQADVPSTGDVTRFGEWGTTVDVPVPSLTQTIDLGSLGVK
jgi:hypothetical protein